MLARYLAYGHVCCAKLKVGRLAACALHGLVVFCCQLVHVMMRLACVSGVATPLQPGQ